MTDDNEPSEVVRTTLNAFVECPVCPWVHEREEFKYMKSNRQAAPAVAAAMGVPVDALVSIHSNQAKRRDDLAIDRHLKSHPPRDWLPVLMRHKDRADKAGAPPDGEEPIRTIQLTEYNLEAVAEDTEFTVEQLRDILIQARAQARTVVVRISGIQVK